MQSAELSQELPHLPLSHQTPKGWNDPNPRQPRKPVKRRSSSKGAPPTKMLPPPQINAAGVMSNIPANQPRATAATHWGTRESTEKRQQAANEIVRNILKREAIEDLNKDLHIHFLITLLLVCCYCVLSGSYTFIPALDLHDNTQNILYIVVNILRPLIGIFILIFQYYNLKWPLVYWTLFFK